MHDIPSLFSQKTKKTHLEYLHLQELATLFLAYVRALNKQTNKQTNKRTKREIEKRRRTWQARPFAPPLSSTIAEL